MDNKLSQEQVNNQINLLKELMEKSADPTVNVYIVMALRQLVKVLVLNEHHRFKVWRVNKAIECLCVVMRLMHCTKELKSELFVITCQLKNSCSLAIVDGG